MRRWYEVVGRVRPPENIPRDALRSALRFKDRVTTWADDRAAGVMEFVEQ
jgi:hypothetical protein